MRHDQIQPGKYAATVTSSALGFASTGKDQLAIGLDVHLVDPDTGLQCSLPMTWYGFFTEASINITDKALAALGFDAAQRSICELSPEDETQTPLAGVQCQVVIDIEDDQEGNPRPRVKFINRASGGLALKERMEQSQARAFGEQMRKRLIASRGPGQAPAPASGGSRPAAPAGRGAPPAGRPTSGPPAQPQGRPPAARGPAPAQGQQQPAQGQPDFDDIPF